MKGLMSVMLALSAAAIISLVFTGCGEKVEQPAKTETPPVEQPKQAEQPAKTETPAETEHPSGEHLE
jgi:predicted small lipoprotein YifL